MTQSYRRALMERNYEVTPEQNAAHRHILEGAVPAKKSLEQLLGSLDRLGALDRDEFAKIQDAVEVLGGLCIPMALLTVVEDPRQAAASRMFSSMLRARSNETEEDEPASDAPGMRR